MAVVLGNAWDEKLKNEFQKPYYLELREKLKDEMRHHVIYPDMNDIFKSLQLTAYEDVKVVVLGQDPYHGQGQAHGLSFSVKPGVDIPPSLKNIYKELTEDCGCFIPNNGYLEKWARQGVLLLNASLTVRAGMAYSHAKIGWHHFTDEVIKKLNEREKPVVFILWGNFARSKAKLITGRQHLIIESPHPSPLSAHRGFFGSKPFSKANEFLERNGQEPIDWQIENL